VVVRADKTGDIPKPFGENGELILNFSLVLHVMQIVRIVFIPPSKSLYHLKFTSHISTGNPPHHGGSTV
jgi:hypothetical protein